MLSLSPVTHQHLTNLAARLGLTVEAAMDQICQRGDILDHIAAALAVPVPVADVPLRLRLEHPVSDEIASLTVAGQTISTRLDHRHEAFVDVMVRLRYKWNGAAWYRRIDKFSEPLADRLVELGVHLLAAGFIVEIPSQDIADRIAASDYQPEHRLWVTRRVTGHFTDWFVIEWDKQGSDYYRAAALLTGSRCYPGSALVPASSYDEVFDFAAVHGFRLSDGALNLREQARRERDAMLLVVPHIQPAPAPNPLIPAGCTQPHPPNFGILDELADDLA